MKKRILLGLCLAVSVGLFADDTAILSHIQTVNASYQTLSCQFTETFTLAATGKQKQFNGTFYAEGLNRLAMHYEQPNRLLVIDAPRFYLQKGVPDGLLFDMTKNKQMGQLASTLLYSTSGRVSSILAFPNISVSVDAKSDAKHYIVTLLTTAKQPKGYSSIVLYYEKSTCYLTRMEMTEFTKNKTVYTMSQFQVNEPIATTFFAIPQKRK